MTRVVLIQAAPTHWDAEGRLAGRQTLPLTDEARSAIESLVQGLDFPIDAVYRSTGNEASDQSAKIVAGKYQLRPRGSGELDELNVGLWEGLRPEEIRARFPSAFPRWEENALGVNPPDGEPLADAIERLRGALRRILRRNRGDCVALVLRPMALQIILGLLRLQSSEQIGSHLHNRTPIETIDVADEDLAVLVSG